MTLGSYAMKYNTICKRIIIALLSFILVCMQLTGFHISMKYQTSVHISGVFQYIDKLPFAVYLCLGILEFFMFNIFFNILFIFLERKACLGSVKKIMFPRWVWVIVGILLFLCWLPCLAAAYPGFFNYDVSGQLPQAMYSEVQYNSHHPLLHTLIMGKIITLGYYISGQKDITFGIFLYSLFQMVFCAVFFTYFIYCIWKITYKKWIFISGILYYAFFPVIAMFNISTTKDVMCCSLLLFCALQLYFLYENPEQFFYSKKSCIKIIISFIFLCLLRKNSVIAVILLAVIILLCVREYRQKYFILFSVILISYLVCSRGFIVILDAEEGKITEAFSLPIQQIARVYSIYGEDAFDSGELEKVNRVASSEVWENYNPLFADKVKNFINFEPVMNAPIEYLELWLKTGIRYPKEYIMAFLDNTYQAWYPGTSIVKVPNHIYYFDIDMSLDLDRHSKNETLLEFYRKISEEYYYQKLPVIRLFFSVGAMFWMALVTICYGLWCRDQSIIYSMILIMAFCLTNLLGPVVLVRYYLMLFYGFPVFLGYLFKFRNSYNGRYL